MHRYLFFLLVLTTPALAQTELSMPNCSEAPVPIDSVNRLIAVRVRAINPDLKIPYQFLDGLAQAIASRLEVPKEANLRILSRVTYRPDSNARATIPRDLLRKPKAVPSLDASVYFTLTRDGDITKIVKANISNSAEVMSGMMQAMQSAFYTNTGAIVLPPGIADKSIALELRIGTFQDSAQALGDSIEKRWQPAHWIKLPVYAMSRYPGSISMPGVKPVYPKNAQRSGTEGKVTLIMAINENGTVIPGAINVTDTKYSDFLKSVLKVVPEMQFEPAALANGCAVQFEAAQPFQFELR